MCYKRIHHGIYLLALWGECQVSTQSDYLCGVSVAGQTGCLYLGDPAWRKSELLVSVSRVNVGAGLAAWLYGLCGVRGAEQGEILHFSKKDNNEQPRGCCLLITARTDHSNEWALSNQITSGNENPNSLLVIGIGLCWNRSTKTQFCWKISQHRQKLIQAER